MLPRANRAKVPFYSDDLLPQLQQVLAILADLETRYEIDCEWIESWSGPKEVKDHRPWTALAAGEQSWTVAQGAWGVKRLESGCSLPRSTMLPA
jgi:hypothetical protein